MCSNFTLFRQAHSIPQLRTEEETNTLNKLYCFYYEIENSTSLISELREALELTNKYLFPYIDTITDINKLISYIFRNTSIPCTFGEQFEGLSFLKADKYFDVIKEKAIMQEEEYKRKLEMQKYGYEFGCTCDEYERMVKEREEYINRQITPIEEVLHSPDLYSKYNGELKKRRDDNLTKLKQYGLSTN